MNKKDKGFIHEHYLLFGITGCSIAVINMIVLMLIKNGILRIEYNLFFSVVLPNTISKILLGMWVIHYCFTTFFKRDINIFARDILGLIVANILIVAFDESTILYYLAQSIPCAMIYIFMCIIISRLRDTLRTKSDTNRVFVLNILMYILIILQIFIMAISFSNYDPYLVAFVGFSYLCIIIGMIEIKKIETRARLTSEEDSGIPSEDADEKEFYDEDDEEDYY